MANSWPSWLLALSFCGCGLTTEAPRSRTAAEPKSNVVASDTVGAGSGPGMPLLLGNTRPIPHDDMRLVLADHALTLDASLLDNDVDLDGDTLHLVSVKKADHGTVTASTSSTWLYTPDSGYVGPDTVSYVVSDGRKRTTGSVRVYVAGTVYYVSNAGSDSNTGTSVDAPWKTLARAQSAIWAWDSTMQGGDVIALERGSTFRESLILQQDGTADAPFVMASYGEGDMPEIVGSDLVSGWTDEGGGIWSAPLSAAPEAVYADGERMTLARYPNSGWLATDSVASNVLSDSALTEGTDHWKGATVRIRSIAWAYENATVTSSGVGSLTTDGFSYGWTLESYDGWGYFLDGLKSMLDAPGEWYFDPSAGRLYVVPSGGVDPDTQLIEATVRSEGVELASNHQVLDSIGFRHHNQTSASLSYLKSDVKVVGCDFHDTALGVQAFDDDVTLDQNTIERTWEGGIKLDGANAIVRDNTLNDIAIYPGYGAEVWGYMGADISSENGLIEGNHLDNIGYIGIVVAGSNTVVQGNITRRAVSVLNDGGGMGMDFCDGLVFQDNIILDTVGNYENTSPEWYETRRKAVGLYIGNHDVHDLTVRGNVIAGNSEGIWNDHTQYTANNVFEDNVFFDNENFQFGGGDWSMNIDNTGDYCRPSFDDTVTGNTMLSTAASQQSVHLLEVWCVDELDWGTFDDNRLYNPYSDSVVWREDQRSPLEDYGGGVYGYVTSDYTLPEWQANSGEDLHSTTWNPALMVDPSDPDAMKLLVNDLPVTTTMDLGSSGYQTLDGFAVAQKVRMPPMSTLLAVRPD